MAAIVTLLTDFGLEDSYVAEVKGVILSQAPEVRLVDVTHLVPPQDVLRGALVLAAAFHRFPPGTVHLAVVDPGVGTARRALAVAAGGHYFVGPDNGLLSIGLERLGVLGRARPAPTPGLRPGTRAPEGIATPGSGRSPAGGSSLGPPLAASGEGERGGSQGTSPLGAPPLRARVLRSGARAVHLTEPRFWLAPVSPTFHGRDLFAPVAASLARPGPAGLEEMGVAATSLLAIDFPRAHRAADGTVRGQVVAVDRFGNLVTNLRPDDVPQAARDLEVEIAGRRVREVRSTYGDDGLVALVASAGYLEIAVVGGSAAQELGVGPAARVVLRPRV